jgi:hypothetical protein
MQQTLLAIVSDSDSIESSEASSMEVFSTTDIDVTQHVSICQALVNYCSHRTGHPESAFPINAIKSKDEKSPDLVRFGASVSVDQNFVAKHEVASLRVELGNLALRILNNDNQLLMIFDHPNLDEETIARINEAQGEALRELRKTHGGERLKKPLKITTDVESPVILSRPC